MPELVGFNEEQMKIIQSYRQRERQLEARISELVEQADATYAPYKQMVDEARAETDKYSTQAYQLVLENKRLREALDVIAVGPNDAISRVGWRRIAREALEDAHSITKG
jgi:hypothetical protein